MPNRPAGTTTNAVGIKLVIGPKVATLSRWSGYKSRSVGLEEPQSGD
jgi:hypothetical protein